MTKAWKEFEKAFNALSPLEKGGPGSGHHGHRGRPGLRGGGLPGRLGPAPGNPNVPDVEAPEQILEEGLPKRTAVTGNYQHLNRAADNPSQREVENLGGGVCNSYKVRIKDDGKACYKPDIENSYYYDRKVMGQLIPQNKMDEAKARGAELISIRKDLDDRIPFSAREKAAHEIDRGLGFNVTPDMVVRDFGRGNGSALSWINGKFDIGDKDSDRNHKDLEKIGTLDFLMGNTDRHMGNIIRGEDGRLYAPDNGLSFPHYKRAVYGGNLRNNVPIQILRRNKNADGLTYQAINPKIKEAVRKFDEPKIRRAMKGLSENEIKGVLRRRARFLASDTWRDIHERLQKGDPWR